MQALELSHSGQAKSKSPLTFSAGGRASRNIVSWKGKEIGP